MQLGLMFQIEKKKNQNTFFLNMFLFKEPGTVLKIYLI